MSLGVSLFLLAVGAVLAFAVNYQLAEVDIAAVGWILMAVGVVGIFVAKVFFIALLVVLVLSLVSGSTYYRRR
jgi:hypothetical protein